MEKKWNKESITELLMKSDKAVERAILVVYNNQTSDEKSQGTVKHHNAKGFLPFHAHKGSYYAKWILSGKHLSGRHLDNARTMSLKYTRQLMEAIKEKETVNA